jgi:hypothetical protein
MRCSLIRVAISWDYGARNKNVIRYSPHSGRSMKDAIIITGAQTHYDSVAAEYEYLGRIFGEKGEDYCILEQGLLRAGQKHFDVVKVRLSDDSRQTFFFDITESYEKFVIYPQ